MSDKSSSILVDFYERLKEHELKKQRKIEEYLAKSKDQAEREKAQVHIREKEQQAELEESERIAKAERNWDNLSIRLRQLILLQQDISDDTLRVEDRSIDPRITANVSQLSKLKDESSKQQAVSQLQVLLATSDIHHSDFTQVISTIREAQFPIAKELQDIVRQAQTVEMQLQTLANDLQKSLHQNNNKQRRRAISNELSALLQHRGIQNTDHSLIDQARELLELASITSSSPQKGSLSLTSGTGVMAITKSFPHILRQQRQGNNKTFEGFENEDQESAWQNFLNRLSSFASSSPTISIQQVLIFTNDTVQLFKQLIKGVNANILEGVFTAVISSLVDTIQRVNREMKKDISQLYALLTCCIYRQLSSSHRKLLTQALLTVINEYPVLIPNFLAVPTTLQFVDQVAVLRYVCAFISYDSEVSYNFGVLEIGFLWQWLQRAGQQLHVLLQASRDHLTLSSALSVDQCAEFIQKCLTRAGYPLYLRYQQQFMQLVTALRQVIITANNNNAACNELKRELHTLLSKDQAPLPVFYHFQDAFIIDGMLAIQSIEEVDKQFKALESDRQGAFMQRVKALGIDRLRSIFNKISSTTESQQTAVAALLEKIVLSSQESPEMLRYTMLKIVHNILQDCQETFFSEMNESGPTRLARVLNGLCQEITELQPVVRGLFSRTCPLLLPRLLPEPTGENMDREEVYLHSLGYIKKQETWESQDKWLARMAKILSVFAVMCLLSPSAAAGGQQQLIFNLDVLWLWVVRVVNISARCKDSPPLFVATVLEVVLKIGAPTLFNLHQKAFMDVMILIERRLLPKMMSLKDMPKREALKQFVETFVRSRGSESISLFTS